MKISQFIFIAFMLLSQFCLAKTFRTVVIDPGHGGKDTGAKNGYVYEKHLTLDTSLRVQKYLKKAGFNVIMTRSSDVFISLDQRVSIANKYPDAIFVSIHYNHTFNNGASGIETYFYNDRGKILANAVQQSINNNLKTNDRNIRYARYYVIKNTTIPAILVECGFVSNEEEKQRMMRADYRDQLAEGIAEGILRFQKSGL